MSIASCETTTSQKKELSYLDWKPVIQPEEIFKSQVGFSSVQTHADKVYWLELRPDEGGRNVLIEADASGKMREITPKEYNVRSRVFEYGSDPYIVFGNWVYFSNYKDQRLYRQDLRNPLDVVAVTPAKNKDGTIGKYAELNLSPDQRWLIFAYEKEPKSGHPTNHVGMIDLQKSGEQEAKILTQGADFYKQPVFSHDGNQVAWIEWSHPSMQWDSSRIYIAPFKNGELNSKSKKLVSGSDQSAIWDIQFSSNGQLVFSEDFAGEKNHSPKNFANVFSYQNGVKQALTNELQDFYYLKTTGADTIGITHKKGEASIVRIRNGSFQTVQIGDYVDFGTPALSHDGTVNVVALSTDRPSELISFSSDGKIKVLKKATNQAINKQDASQPELIEFPTQDGEVSYGYFYPPQNSRYYAKQGEKPPVRVLVHGGPTAMTSKSFGLSKMFWTSQGFAIFDVNYRGSLGFGRRYRDALKKKWGLLDVQDVKDGLHFLKKSGKISDQAVITGGSAGGYTVQRALTYYPELFTAGASHYGIGNLVTLQKITHKFEAHYLEQLIGGTLQNNLKEYEARSPINHLKNLVAPMIIFQGSDDKVVPPENSREMAEILKKKGIPYEYYEYSGEEHGFRKKETLVLTLTRESMFFKRILMKKD